MINNRLPKIWYGGDYNPEQWDDVTISEDMRMFKLAGIDVATVNVFSWALNQPDETTYHFTWLDETLDRLYENGVYVCLATSTAAHPAWMAKRYPDIRRVDFEGRKRQFGGRHNSCPNSPTYRKYAVRMANKLAERYNDHPAVVAWHVSNEYGGYCYCDNCQKAFRVWLKEKYGTIEEVNRVWNTSFWGHTFYEWDEIVVPNGLSEEWQGGQNTNFQGISLDYRRFQSDSLLEVFKLERDAIKQHSSDIPITTNLMGLYPELDYFKWGKEMDIVSWDNYPSIDTPVSLTAMTHDLMRGLKSGQPFMLMEQTPSQQNWQPYNALKRPGVMRQWSYQAVAHGADTVMFFQLRRSRGATEKYHGAVIEHVGHEHTRVFRESAQLGKELIQLEDKIIDSRINARVAIVFDWENRWAIGLSSGPSVALDYVKEVHKYYNAFYERNIPVDMIGVDEDVTPYDIVIAPVLYMVKQGHAERLKQFVQGGGTFVTTFFSGVVDENDLVTLGGYPGELRELVGIWAEEIDALEPTSTNEIVMQEKVGSLSGNYTCNLLFDLIHAESAEVIATYGSDFYKGMPVLTRNKYGNGQAYYIASSPEQAFVQDFIDTICADNDIVGEMESEQGVEVIAREKNGETIIFVMNHNNEIASFDTAERPYTNVLTGESYQGKINIAPKETFIFIKGEEAK
ncbi:beta-galactosidase [Gracilibacillus sp. S3-1-1]|uniref:Beta-galactosidase n=1 Tax=Gracilibacillus pellucidus TaxID=3095368 RepID=A0ACC6M117_9BACI|nr:beta-galactosidase [Gracilibacillus sp. S3-1-1]MDX8044567.1 beta-galactosidase [Gracilibacillus sp. S3-1-1]